MLEQQLKSLPDSSGVYKFFDIEDKLLYVGKAKVLKNRVKSYFKFTPHLLPANKLSPRITKMIHETKRLEYIVSSNEYDALILENSLIKELKPKYNILLRDDKTYPYISLDLTQEFPRFEITRKIEKNSKIRYFGPFSTGARDILEALYLCHNLVQKKSCIKSKKACLFYQIQRCHAPCENKINKENYFKIVESAKSNLIDRKKLISKLHTKMLNASEALNFEEAAKLRDLQNGITNTLHTISLDLAKVENFDLFAIQTEKNIASFMQLFIREGKVVSSIKKVVKNSLEYDRDELYKRILLQFYKTNAETIPKTIFTAHEFEYKEDILNYVSHRFDKKIIIKKPQRGDKLALSKIALENAKENLEKYKLSATTNNTEKELQSFFDLSLTPIRIEAFDNSHHGGDAPIGSMIVYEDGEWKKDAFRIFNLQSKDEYSQMRELLTRRIAHFKDEPAPDLWLIDGGATLLKLAKQLLDEHDISIDLLAIAKEKRDFKAYRAKSKAQDIVYTLKSDFKLSTSDLKLQMLQKLRDEAHRFAITSHRKRKQKNDMKIELSQIPHIGPATIKKLLSYFGDFESIYNASKNELKKVIGEKNAINLYDFLRK